MITEEERIQAEKCCLYWQKSKLFHAVKNISNVLVQHGFHDFLRKLDGILEGENSYFCKAKQFIPH